MSLGTLTVQPLSDAAGGDAGGIVNLDILNFDDGFPHADPSWVVEPITAMGVNYSRLRLVRKEYIPFRLSSISGYPTYGNAVTAARQRRQFVGHLATLEYTAGGVLYNLDTPMYINSVVAFPVAGTLIGAALTYPNSQAFVRTQFNLQFVVNAPG